MKNFIKNVLRSFKNNKISIIGLVFLIFFGLGVFCIMSNTTQNISNQYDSISTSGNIHDFTASELYDIGNAVYTVDTKGVYVTGTGRNFVAQNKLENPNPKQGEKKEIAISQLCTGARTEDEKTYFFTIPEQQKLVDEKTKTTTFVRSYHLILDPDYSTGLYSKFATQGSMYVEFDVKINQAFNEDEEIPEELNALQELQEAPVEQWIEDHIDAVDTVTADGTNIYQRDYSLFTKQVNDHTNVIFSLMTTSNTPLSQELNKNYKNELDYRFFKSINVTATKDNIFYKVIDSNPSDTIDKIVMFDDPNGSQGYTLYNSTDAQPYGSEIKILDDNGKQITPGTSIDNLFTIPSTFDDVALTHVYRISETQSWSSQAKLAYSQIMRIRFQRMHSGNNTKAELVDKDTGVLVKLSALGKQYKTYSNDFFNPESEIGKAYEDYYSNYYEDGAETVTVSANGNIIFGWTGFGGTPQTCTISNWTSNLSIVNPQHLSAVGKRVLDPRAITSFQPFRKWYNAIYGKEYTDTNISKELACEWFNSLNSTEFAYWINPDRTTSTSSLDYYAHVKDFSDDKKIEINPVTVKKSEWKGIDNSQIVDCGGYFQIIWGCGLTPDFVYPVVDISRPTPNVNTECLVYCNETGYKSIKLAFANSSVEEYIVGKFKNNVGADRQAAIINEINKWAAENMVYPKGTKVAYSSTDMLNVLNCSSFRIAYIPNLINTINILTIVLCVFIGILCFIICLIIIKRYVENNRVTIGIMRANGISKFKIAVSLFPFALIPSVIGGVGAYVVGFFLQAPALTLFKNYWMLPTPLLGFDWVSFIACIFLPFILFVLICFLATFIVLRISSVELMKPGSEFKASGFSRAIKKPFKYFGVLTRFRVSLAFNSLGRLIVLAIASCLTMTSLVFAFTTMDKLDASRTANSTQYNYSFNVKLTTPTASGSTYCIDDCSVPTSIEGDSVIGYGRTNSDNYIYNLSWDTTDTSSGKLPEWFDEYSKPNLAKYYSNSQITGLIETLGNQYRDTLSKYGNLLVPNISDSTGQVEDLYYLAQKSSSKFTLDYNVGIGTISSNPWEIALALMPANSRNIAADAFNKIMDYVGHKIAEADKKFLDAINTTKLKGCYHDGKLSSYEIEVEKEIDRDEIEPCINYAKQKAGKWSLFTESLDPDHLLYRVWKNSYLNFFNYDKDTDKYTLITDMSVVGMKIIGIPAPLAFNEQFLTLIKTVCSDPYCVSNEYRIVYGVLPINQEFELDQTKRDELYTYITGKMSDISTPQRNDFDPNHEITIEGIKENSNYIKLTDAKNNNLNKVLFENDKDGINEKPIIINAFAAHKYNLHVNDSFVITASNMVDRYDRAIHPNDYKSDESNKIKFKVVGVSIGTTNEAFYTTQNVANNLLGLPNGKTWNKTHKYMMWSKDATSEWTKTGDTAPRIIDMAGVGASDPTKAVIYDGQGNKEEIDKFNPNIPVGFNGMYTLNKAGRPITSTMPLYSYTGFYPSTSVFNSEGDAANNKMTIVLMKNNNLALANIASGINNPKYAEGCRLWCEDAIDENKYREQYVTPFINDLVKYFGATTMITAINGGMDVAASDLIYTNLINTFNMAETSIMAIIIPITIIIVGIISNIIINDSKRLAAMLKALGYSDKKNISSILALFIPTILIGIALAVPLVYGITIGYQAIIFNTANILVDVTQKWWYYIVAIGGIGVILGGTYAAGFVSLKRDRLVDQIK